MFKENQKDQEVREMYLTAPYPFVSFEHFEYFKNNFLKDLEGIVDTSYLKDKSILDVGCGTGEKTCILAGYAREITGVDVSSESLKHARDNSVRLNITNINFIEGSVLNLDKVINDKLYDVVFCSGVLHHTSDPYKGFLNIIKHLKPGGLLIISLYHPLGLLGYHIRYKLIGLIAGNNPDKRFKIASRLFYYGKDIKDPQLRSKIFDTYVHPQIDFYSTYYLYNKWFIPNKLVIKNVHAKYSSIRFMLAGMIKLNLRLRLIDLWYGIRRKGFVYISAIKDK